IGSIDLPGRVHRDSHGREQSEGGGASEHRGNDAARHDLADAQVLGIGEVDVAGKIDGQSVGEVDLGGGSRAAVARVACDAGSGDGGDDALSIDSADQIVVRIGEIQNARMIDGDALDVSDLGGHRGSAIADGGTAGNGADTVDDAGRGGSGGKSGQ